MIKYGFPCKNWSEYEVLCKKWSSKDFHAKIDQNTQIHVKNDQVSTIALIILKGLGHLNTNYWTSLTMHFHIYLHMYIGEILSTRDHNQYWIIFLSSILSMSWTDPSVHSGQFPHNSPLVPLGYFYCSLSSEGPLPIHTQERPFTM